MSSYARFHKTTIEFFEFIISCNDEIPGTDTKKLAFVVKAMKNYSPETLVEDFVSYENYSIMELGESIWQKIAKKDGDFITKDFVNLYRNTSIDVNLLVNPYIVHKKYEAKGKSDSCPISYDDIDSMWLYLFTLIRISCNYIYNKRITDINYMKYINLDKMTQLFEFKLKID